MTSYKVKWVSQKNAIILVISSLAIFLFCTWKYFPNGHGGSLQLILWLSIVIMAFFAWQKLVTGRTTWVIEKEGVSISWIKKFAWTDNVDSILKWEEIISVSRGNDPHYDILKISLVTGENLRFIHDPLVTRDDFEEMLKVLYKSFNERNHLAGK